MIKAKIIKQHIPMPEDAIKMRAHCVDAQERQLRDLFSDLGNYTVKSGSLIGFLGVLITLLLNKDVAINKEYIIFALIFLLIGVVLCALMIIPKTIDAHLDYEDGPMSKNYLMYLKDRYEALLGRYSDVEKAIKDRKKLLTYTIGVSFIALLILIIGFIHTNNQDETKRIYYRGHGFQSSQIY